MWRSPLARVFSAVGTNSDMNAAAKSAGGSGASSSSFDGVAPVVSPPNLKLDKSTRDMLERLKLIEHCELSSASALSTKGREKAKEARVFFEP